MPCVVTTIHRPAAVIAACRALGLDPPIEGTVRLDAKEVFGWVVRLPALRYPVVCDTLSGRVAYHVLDNAFGRHSHLMRFLRLCFDTQAQLRRGDSAMAVGTRRRPVPAEEVA